MRRKRKKSVEETEKKQKYKEKMSNGSRGRYVRAGEGHWVRPHLTLGFPQQLPHYHNTGIKHCFTHQRNQPHRKTCPFARIF